MHARQPSVNTVSQLCQLLGYTGFLLAMCCVGLLSSALPSAAGWGMGRGLLLEAHGRFIKGGVGTIHSGNPASAPCFESLTPSTQLWGQSLNRPSFSNAQS